MCKSIIVTWIYRVDPLAECPASSSLAFQALHRSPGGLAETCSSAVCGFSPFASRNTGATVAGSLFRSCISLSQRTTTGPDNGGSLDSDAVTSHVWQRRETDFCQIISCQRIGGHGDDPRGIHPASSQQSISSRKAGLVSGGQGVTDRRHPIGIDTTTR